MAIRRNDLDVHYIVQEYLSGKSEKRLADELGVNRWTIRQRLLGASVKPRNRRAAEFLKWSQMSPEGRNAQVAAAHDATRGSKQSAEHLLRRAARKQIAGRFDSVHELAVASMLYERGIDGVPQQAIGKYNCDLGIRPVAVEVFGGNWHTTSKRGRQRRSAIRYMLNAGWNVYIVLISQRHPIRDVMADDLVAYIQTARRNPPSISEYRMVRSDGKCLVSGSANDDEISLVISSTNSRNPTTGRYESVRR